MSKFAKVIGLDNGDQVLVHVDYNDPDDTWTVVIKTKIDGIVCEATLGFDTEEICQRVMEDFDKESAEDFYKGMEDSLLA